MPLAATMIGLTAIAAFEGSYWWGLTILSHAAMWSWVAYTLRSMSLEEVVQD